MRRLFRTVKSTPSSPRKGTSPIPRSQSEVSIGNRRDDLDSKMERALDAKDEKGIQTLLQDPELGRTLILYRFMELLAIRIGSAHPETREEALNYFTTYATELDPDDVLVLVVSHLDTTQVLGYVSYCTRGGWDRVMRAALQRQDPVIIRYIWDTPERPRQQALRKILLSYLEGTGIPLKSLRYLLHLVYEKEGHVLVLLREDTDKREGLKVTEILDSYD